MTARTPILVVVCGTFLIAGCGLKGPLYLPEKKTQSVSDKEEKKSEQQKGGTPAPADTPTASPSASP